MPHPYNHAWIDLTISVICVIGLYMIIRAPLWRKTLEQKTRPDANGGPRENAYREGVGTAEPEID